MAKDTLPRRADEMRELFKRGTRLDQHSITEALKPWAAADFPAALEFASKLEGFGKEQIVVNLIGGLAESDPDLARQLALKLQTGPARQAEVSAIGSVMAKSDPGAALDWINQIGGEGRGAPPFYSNPASSAIAAAVAANPVSAAQLLLDRPGLFEDSEGPGLVSDLFEQWAVKDSAGAAAWLEAHPLSETHQKAAEAALAQIQVRRLPLDEALSGWAGLPEDSRKASQHALMERLVNEDPGHALERLATKVPENERGEVIASLMGQLGAEQFKQALPYLAELGAYLQKDPGAARSFSRLSPEQLDQAAKAMPPQAATALRNAVLEATLESDPGRALNMMAETDPASLNPYTASRLAASMANGDPGKASAWVAGFPEGPNKEWAALNLVANWAKYDPAAATAWVEGLPPGRSRDRATLEAVKIQGAFGGGPETALRLAAGIQDSKDRSEATGYALQSLWRKDPAAATSSLGKTGLSATDQAALSTKLAAGGFLR